MGASYWAFYFIGAAMTCACVGVVLVSFLSIFRRELIPLVGFLAFAVIGLGGIRAALEVEPLLRMQFAGDPFERAAFVNRISGPYAWLYWLLLATVVVLPQLYWIRKFRTTPWISMLIGLALLWPLILELVAGLKG